MFFNKKANIIDKISVETAYILWRNMVDRNTTLEYIYVLKNFVYSKDFKIYLNKLLEDYRNESNNLNKIMNKYSIVGPDPCPSDQNTIARPDIINDQLIAKTLYKFLRLDVTLLMLHIKEIPINEEIYNFIQKLIKDSIIRIDHFIQYLKGNNWLYQPPTYRHTNPEVSKNIAINDVFLLWDHLVYRYNNIRLTQIASVYAQDNSFEGLLTMGIKLLQSEVKEIEEKLLYYGVIIPKAYPSATVDPKDKDMFEDRFMYNLILRGIQDAVALHGSSIQEVINCDELRKFFIKLTFNELSILEKFIKFGESKGWTNQTPIW